MLVSFFPFTCIMTALLILISDTKTAGSVQLFAPLYLLELLFMVINDASLCTFHCRNLFFFLFLFEFKKSGRKGMVWKKMIFSETVESLLLSLADMAIKLCTPSGCEIS